MADHTISGGQKPDWIVIGDNDSVYVERGGSVESRFDAITSFGINNYVGIAFGGSVISSEGTAIGLNDHNAANVLGSVQGHLGGIKLNGPTKSAVNLRIKGSVQSTLGSAISGTGRLHISN